MTVSVYETWFNNIIIFDTKKKEEEEEEEEEAVSIFEAWEVYSMINKTWFNLNFSLRDDSWSYYELIESILKIGSGKTLFTFLLSCMKDMIKIKIKWSH
jgi:hypothetical protein